MAKKVRKKTRGSGKENGVATPSPKKVVEVSKPVESVDEVVSVPKETISCPHLVKGVNLTRLTEKIGSSGSIRCEDCRESAADRRGGKGKGKHGKKKGGASVDSKSESKSIWVCLECGQYTCGGLGLPVIPKCHVVGHSRKNRHPLVVHSDKPQLCWCFPCDMLIQVDKIDKTDETSNLLSDVVKLLKGRSSEKSSVDVEDASFKDDSLTSEIKSGILVTSDSQGQGGYVVRGMANLGNTCFFNSVMQNLLAMNRLRDIYIKLDAPAGPLISSLKKLFTETNPESGLKNIINPRSFFGCVCTKSPQFRGYQQHDSHELLRCLLDGLSTEELAAVVEPSIRAMEGVIDVEKVCVKKEAVKDEVKVVKVVKKEVVEERRIPNLEDGEFPDEPGWSLLGRKVEVAISTARGVKRLVDNEIVHFNFPLPNYSYKSQWIVRISTIRSGEVGRLPMEWAKAIIPLVQSGNVKVRGRCIAAPYSLQMMQEIMLLVSFYVHSSVFTECVDTSWRLEACGNINTATYPLLTLLNMLEIKPHRKADFTPDDIDTRKRLLYRKLDSDEAAALPLVKRRKGGEPAPEQNEDEQAISESALNKIIGAAEIFDLEEKAAPRTLTCELKPYQSQALYWMSEIEKGIDISNAESNLHPCWSAYNICNGRSIYVNIFTGEATNKFPKATKMARGGILADAMGLGKTVMTIALILSNPGRSKIGNNFIDGVNDNIITNKRKNASISNNVQGGTLIVCPMALLGQWKDELETHSAIRSISIFVHYGGGRTNSAELISEYDVVLTTYGVLSAAFRSDGENSIYHKIQWYRVVLDEAHHIKAHKSQVAQAAFALSSHCRWCLTGTPIQNSLEDLFSLLHFLGAEPWCSWAWWHKLVQRPYENNDPRALKLVKGILRTLMLRRTKETKDKYGRPILVLPPTDIKLIECEQSESERDFYDALFTRSKVQFDQYVAQGKVLHHYANILDLLMQLRRCCNHPFLVLCGSNPQKYADLSRLARKFLQTNTESSDICAPSDPQQHAELNRLASRFLQNCDSASNSIQSRGYIDEVLEHIQKGDTVECSICMDSPDDPVFTPCAHRFCRECLFNCWGNSAGGNCPICRQSLLKSDLITCPSESPFKVDIENNMTESSKVSELMKYLERIQMSTDEKSIVFSQWTSFFDLLENPLRSRGIGYLRFHGKLTQKQREKVLDEFNKTSEKRVLLMSLKAGGVGLNLTAASNVFLMDPWWNPAVEEQAIMRIHRIGQKRKVIVRRFIVKNTVEARLQQVQARKQMMISGALTDDEVRSARIHDLKILFS